MRAEGKGFGPTYRQAASRAAATDKGGFSGLKATPETALCALDRQLEGARVYGTASTDLAYGCSESGEA